MTGSPELRIAAAVAILCAIAPANAGPGDTPGEIPAPTGPFVRVLGTVQDGGMPHAACEHDSCRRVRDGGAAPRWISSLAVVLPGSAEVFIIDATPDIRPQLDLLRDVRQPPSDQVDRSPLDGVFLTHAHIGHYLGLAFFGFEAVHTRNLPVWATPRMAAFLRGNGPWSQLVTMGNVQLHELAPETAVQLSPEVSITPFLVPHREEFSDTVAYLVRGPARTVLFVPDTDRWTTWQPSLTERLAGVDVALLDGTFFSADELPGRKVEEIGHPMIGATMDLLADRVAAGNLEVLFIHLNHSNPALVPGSAEARELAGRGFGVAREGQDLPLD